MVFLYYISLQSGVKIIFHKIIHKTQPVPWEFVGNTSGFLVPEPFCFTHPCAGTSHQESSGHYGLPKEHQDKEKPSFHPAYALQNSNVFFSVPLANAGDFKGWKELKKLKSRNRKERSEQTLNKTRIEPGEQYCKDSHSSRLNKGTSLSLITGLYTMTVSIQPVEF